MSLTKSELSQLNRNGERIKSNVRSILQLVPNQSRTITGLTNWSGVNKSTCQRFIHALTKSASGLDVLLMLPGIKGLHQLADSLNQLLDDEQLNEYFSQLIELYKDNVHEHARSHSQLKTMITSAIQAQQTSPEEANFEIRKQLYQANSELVGESIESSIGIQFLQVNKQDTDFLSEFIVTNRNQVVLKNSARPLIQTFVGNEGQAAVLSKPKALLSTGFDEFDTQHESTYLLQDYSHPRFSECFKGVGKLQNSLIYDHTSINLENKLFNATLGYFNPNAQHNPLTTDAYVNTHGAFCRSPTKRNLIISLIEKRLALHSIPKAGCYQTSVKIQETSHHSDEIWNDRLTGTPEITLFNPASSYFEKTLGLDHVGTLIEQCAEMLQVDLVDYLGYYIDIDYPIWLTTYRIYFDFE